MKLAIAFSNQEETKFFITSLKEKYKKLFNKYNFSHVTSIHSIVFSLQENELLTVMIATGATTRYLNGQTTAIILRKTFDFEEMYQIFDTLTKILIK